MLYRKTTTTKHTRDKKQNKTNHNSEIRFFLPNHLYKIERLESYIGYLALLFRPNKIFANFLDIAFRGTRVRRAKVNQYLFNLKVSLFLLIK